MPEAQMWMWLGNGMVDLLQWQISPATNDNNKILSVQFHRRPSTSYAMYSVSITPSNRRNRCVWIPQKVQQVVNVQVEVLSTYLPNCWKCGCLVRLLIHQVVQKVLHRSSHLQNRKKCNVRPSLKCWSLNPLVLNLHHLPSLATALWSEDQHPQKNKLARADFILFLVTYGSHVSSWHQCTQLNKCLNDFLCIFFINSIEHLQ